MLTRPPVLGLVGARQQAFGLLDHLRQGLAAHKVRQQAKAVLGHLDTAGPDQRLRFRTPEIGDGISLEIDDLRQAGHSNFLNPAIGTTECQSVRSPEGSSATVGTLMEV
jgi:hypothetical protein